MSEAFEQKNTPTQADFDEALRKAEQLGQNKQRIHTINNMEAVLALTFQIGDRDGWSEETLFGYRKAEQMLRLFSEGKIKETAPHVTGYVWAADNTPYDQNTIIG